MLWELLPTNGSSIEIASQQLFALPPPLRQKNSRITPEVEEIVMMSLAKDPHQRFESAVAFANALEQASGVEVRLLLDSNIVNSREVPVISVPPAIESGGITVTTPDQVMLTPPSSSIPKAVSTPETSLPQHQLKSISRLSRRAVVGGLIGITALVAVGGFAIAWEVSQMPVVTYRGHSGPVYTAAWSPDARLIVSGGADNTAQVWEAATGNHLLTFKGHTQSVNALMWSPISAWKIASASDDKTLQVWETSTSKRFLTYRGHSELVWSAMWSPNGNYIASTSVDTTVQVWDAFTGKQLVIYTGHPKPVTVAIWSPDGRLLASGSEDTTVQIWEATTGKHLSTYRGHIGTVNSLSWSPDGSRITSGSADATVQVWDVATRRLIHSYDDHSGAIMETALWSPTGRNIASARSSGIVQVWNAP
jgi:WD40 repeat protein